MGILDDAKELVALIKTKDDIDLYRKIVELEAQIIELSRAKFDAEQEAADLRRHRGVLSQLTFRSLSARQPTAKRYFARAALRSIKGLCSGKITGGPKSGAFIAPCRSDRIDGPGTFETVM